jgi:hypothetical protein
MMPRDLLAPRDLLEPRKPRDLLSGSPASTPTPPAKRERRGDLAPIIRDLDTGEWRWAVPNLLLGLVDAVQLPGEVMRGEVDPMSDEGFDRTMNLATLAAPAAGLRGTISRTGTRAVEQATQANRREFGMDFPPVATRTPPEKPVTPSGSSVKPAGGVVSSSSSPAGNFAGNIRLDRIWAPDDVQAAIRQAAEHGEGFLEARRGVISQEQTRDLSQLVGMTPERLTSRKTGAAFNAEEMFSARNLLVEQATKVRDLARKAEGGSDLEKLTFQQELTRLQAIQEQVAGATAEAGRTLQQFRMLAGVTKDELTAMASIAKEGGLDDIIAGINKLDDPAQVAAFAAKAGKATFRDMLYEGWINGLLSGPTTHSVNVMSNTLTALWSVPETALASGISRMTGSGIRGGEATARLFGMVEGAKEGVVAGYRAFRSEIPSDGLQKLEQSRQRSIPSLKVGKMEVGGKQVRIPGRLLLAEDELFKAIGFRQELNALAYRRANREGLKGREFAERVSQLRANPTEDMTRTAKDSAARQTFTNPLGPGGQAIMSAARRLPFGRIVLPFVRTPANIVKYAAERTPAAPFFKEFRDNLTGKNGPVARDQAIARMTLGTAVSTALVGLAPEGSITGGGPYDPAKRALMRADGWQPYSVKVDDTYYSYGRVEPLGMLLGVAADFAELRETMTDSEADNVAGLIFGSVAKNLTEKTWLRGPSDLIQALTDPERYGAAYVRNLVGTVVPTGLSQIANARDPMLREARTVLDTIRSRVPGQRETLFVRRDVFGEPISREGALGPDLGSPIYRNAARNDPTIAEMLRLGVSPGPLQRRIRSAELMDAEFDFYSQAAGRTMKQGLDALASSPQWADLPDDVRAEAMGDLIRKSRDLARTATVMKFPDLALRIRRAKQGKEDMNR